MANLSTMMGKMKVRKEKGCTSNWKDIMERVRKWNDLVGNSNMYDFYVSVYDENFIYTIPKEGDTESDSYIFDGHGRYSGDNFARLWMDNDDIEKFTKNHPELNNVSIIYTYDEEEIGSGFLVTGAQLIVSFKDSKIEIEVVPEKKLYSSNDLVFTDEWVNEHFEFFTLDDIMHWCSIIEELDNIFYILEVPIYVEAKEAGWDRSKDVIPAKEFLAKKANKTPNDFFVDYIINFDFNKYPKFKFDRELLADAKVFYKAYKEGRKENEIDDDFALRISGGKANSLRALIEKGFIK